ncbi:flavodoxin [Brevundimonas naejangsanensis]|uniref:flavodoxin n=1 Tax=Brevundimonas naejangsanensis TaxID=588932 RepID=UPI0004176F40|nr:flavodoxin [Brevundimonas naejangsanensis]
MTDLSRRTMLTAPAILSLSAGAAACAETVDSPRRATSNVLVAYFSRSGNTRVIAGTIQRLLGADLFEIRPAQPYPEDYEATVAQARQERDSGHEPPLAATVPDIAAYDTVFLGFPIWGQTAPPVIRSFLRAHDLTNRTVRPFITHGGYGLGSSRVVLSDHSPRARIEPPFVMEADQERRTLDQVKAWLGQGGNR